MIENHYLVTLCQILRLYKNTPRSVVYFLAGSLPGIALLHIRQLSLFGMICALPNNILYEHASNYFASPSDFPGSWFQQIMDICLRYQLPDPMTLLSSNLKREDFKKIVKKHVVSYWEETLRKEASSLKSLTYFKSPFMSLVTPHPVWKTAGSSPYKIAMATVQARMLSGRYRTGALTRHWSRAENGSCSLSPLCSNSLEDLPHMLKDCPALAFTRNWLYDFTTRYAASMPLSIQYLLRQKCDPVAPTFIPFILDCSTDPDVILMCQNIGFYILDDLFSVTRTWVYVLHRERLKLLGRWRSGRN